MYPNLKLEIFKRGIHQNRIAKELKMNEANLSKIINGYRDPSLAQKELLAHYLEADMDWLFEKYEGHNDSSEVSTPAGASSNGNNGES